MRTTFTPDEVREMTAKDLATFERDFPPPRENPSVERMLHLTQDLHRLACQTERDPLAVDELERRISAFLAEEKRYKGMTPYLYMVRALKTSGTPHI